MSLFLVIFNSVLLFKVDMLIIRLFFKVLNLLAGYLLSLGGGLLRFDYVIQLLVLIISFICGIVLFFSIF